MKKLVIFWVIFLALKSHNNPAFIINKSQWDNKILFLAKLPNSNVWITKNSLVFDYFKISNDKLIRNSVFVEYIDANEPTILPKKTQNYYENYFLGNKQITNVKLYKEVILKNLFPNIDKRLYFEDNNLRYDFIVNPGGNPANIKLKISGATAKISKDGKELIIITQFGEVKHSKMFVFQKNKKNIPAKFVKINDNTFSIQVSNYDKTKPMVIDPLVYATFIGGNQFEEANGIVVDNSGNSYIIGKTNSANFPITHGSYNQTLKGNYDVFVTKLNTSGTPVFSTFIGGQNEDVGSDIALTSAGGIVITGYTSSTDFPKTDGNYSGGFNDIFVAVLNSTGNSLTKSYLLGGSSDEQAYAVSVDKNNNIYITGKTNSYNFPVTQNAFDNSFNSQFSYFDAFVMKFSPGLSQTLYSSFLGGSNEDGAMDIVADNSGNTYIIGYTSSQDFPNTGAIAGGWQEVFVTKVNSSGTQLNYSVVIGGDGYDVGTGIAVNSAGEIYATGYATGSNFPVTQGAFDINFGGSSEGFLFKINSTGDTLIFSTLIGGSNDDYISRVVLDEVGNPTVAGWTYSPDFPATSNAYDNSFNSDFDIINNQIQYYGR